MAYSLPARRNRVCCKLLMSALGLFAAQRMMPQMLSAFTDRYEAKFSLLTRRMLPSWSVRPWRRNLLERAVEGGFIIRADFLSGFNEPLRLLWIVGLCWFTAHAAVIS